MEPDSQVNDTAFTRLILEGHLRELYGRVVYTHKAHQKCADDLLLRLARLKVAQITLSAMTTAGFITAIFEDGNVSTVVGAGLSSVLLALNAYMKNYDLGELAQKHRQVGADLWLIREKYLSLITDLRMDEKPLERLQEERDELLEELHSVYSGAPSTNSSSYSKAQKALQENEELTFTDDEIDKFLPKELRRGEQGSTPWTPTRK